MDFLNQLMGNNSTEPKVGEGATELCYSDRHPYQVVEVSEDGMSCKLQAMDAVYAGEAGKGEIGHQNWKYIARESYKTLVWRNNAWCVESTQITFTKKFKDAFEAASGKNFAAMHLSKELRDKIYNERSAYPANVVEGVTKAKKVYSPISIIFGRMEYYYDWSF